MGRRRKKRRGEPEGRKKPSKPLTDAIVETIGQWAEEAADAHDLVLYDVEILPNWTLQVFVKHRESEDPGTGVTVDDCVAVSRYLEAYLDADEAVPEAYTLEVSSPGVQRPLKKRRHFELSAGRDVRIVVHRPLDGKNVFEGELLGIEGDLVRVREGEENWELAWDNIARARLTYDFN